MATTTTQKQPLQLFQLLPREVLDLIIEYALRDSMLLELGEPADLHSFEFDKMVRANNNHLVDLDDGLALLLMLKLKPELQPPMPLILSREVLLHHATFRFRWLGNYEHLSALRYVEVTREQYEDPLLRFRWTKGFREVFGTGLDASGGQGGSKIRTLTVREEMRAGANSATMRSVRYRLGSDEGLRGIVGGRDGFFEELGGGMKVGQQQQKRCKVILRLRVETLMPVSLTVSADY